MTCSSVEALRRPLAEFARMREVQALGIALRAAADGLIAKAPTEALEQWRGALETWEQMERDRPGYHTLVQSGITSEAEAEKLARGTAGDSRLSATSKRRR